MVEKKFALVAALVALTIIGAPLVASATPTVTFKTVGGTTFHAEDSEEHEEHEDDGDDDEDDDHHGYIPPVFVVPGAKKPHHERPRKPEVTAPDSSATTTDPATDPSTGTTAGISSVDPVAAEVFDVVGAGDQPGENSLGGVNPKEARAVDIKRVPVGIRNPAEQFMDTAYIGMGMLGVAALGLGVTAGVRAIRLRRSGKSDYFYDDK